MTVIDGPIFSADSHITEPPDTYTDRIAAAFRDRAPYLQHDDKAGDLFVIPGMSKPVPMGLVAAAGKPAEEITVLGVDFADLHRGGWDPEARLPDQDRDGVAGEIIYPTVGMVLCNHQDLDYKHACMDAYNLWIAEYCGAHPDRLFGIGQTAMRTPEEGIADLEASASLGLKGVMMPGVPGVEDYDSPIYDDFYEAAVDLGLPLSFHILTGPSGAVRGPKINGFLTIVRSCQDVMGTLVFGAVFERHPEPEGRVRRGRRRLGAALHLPDGPRLRAPPQLDAPRRAVEDAERVLQREHLRDVPGRLGGVQGRPPHERRPADVGQRLPALRLDLALVAGDARRAHRPPRRA